MTWPRVLLHRLCVCRSARRRRLVPTPCAPTMAPLLRTLAMTRVRVVRWAVEWRVHKRQRRWSCWLGSVPSWKSSVLGPVASRPCVRCTRSFGALPWLRCSLPFLPVARVAVEKSCGMRYCQRHLWPLFRPCRRRCRRRSRLHPLMPPLKPRCQLQQRRMHPVCSRLTLTPLCTARMVPTARRPCRVTSGAAHMRTIPTTTAPTAVMAGQAPMGMGQRRI